MSGFGPVASLPVASVTLGAPGPPVANNPDLSPPNTAGFKYKWRPLADLPNLNICLTPPAVTPPIRPGTNFVPRYTRKSVGGVWGLNLEITPPATPNLFGYTAPIPATLPRKSKGDVWALNLDLIPIIPGVPFVTSLTDAPIVYRWRIQHQMPHAIMQGQLQFAYLLFASL